MTWREILRLADGYLAARGVPESATAAEFLAARLLKCGRGFLAGRLDEEPDERFTAAMRRGVARLAAGEPVQYVLGEWDFRSLTLACDKRALIPRPETEQLVSRVLDFAAKRDASGRPPFVVDVCTGSGCIILSLATEMDRGVFLGTDASPDAIALASENAARCGLADKVKFAVADGLDDFDEPQSIDIIVSNPPYVPSAECATLDPRIRLHEPPIAFDGGADGLDFVRRFACDAFNLLTPGGAMFLEIGDGQGPETEKILFATGFSSIKIEKDWSGRDRYASAVLP